MTPCTVSSSERSACPRQSRILKRIAYRNTVLIPWQTNDFLILSLSAIRKWKANKASIKNKAHNCVKLLIWWNISSIDKGHATPCFTTSFISFSFHVEWRALRRRIMPDLKELVERGFPLGMRTMEKLFIVSSQSRRNYPFISALTKSVSISTIHPLSAKDSVKHFYLEDRLCWRIFYTSVTLE